MTGEDREQLAPARARSFTEDELALALHHVMCDVSHHDRGRPACHRWRTYPKIAGSVFDNIDRALEYVRR